MVKTTSKIAVIGAGMAGLTCAQSLMQHGMDVVVFDKGRGLGGRMATRRAEGGFQFDHGAQYLSGRATGFNAMLADAQAAGAAQTWARGGTDTAYVGVPGMTGLAKYLGRGLAIRKETHVRAVAQRDGGWTVTSDTGTEPFDRVVITMPAPQIGALLPEGHVFNGELDKIAMAPCLTLMVGLPQGVKLPFVSRLRPGSDIAWTICDSDKPGRPGATCLVAHASKTWSERHLELDRPAVATEMKSLVAELIGADVMGEAAYVAGHRWRYAFVSRPLGQQFLVSEDQTLFAGGDWCLGARAEHAWSSGQAIAEKIANSA